jgi:hypothetical protein
MAQPRDIDLKGEGGTLHLEVEANDWTRCYLLADHRRIYVGAEGFGILASRLITELHSVARGTVGADIFGQPARWVRSLAEAWCGIYMAPQGTDRRLFFLDGRADPVRCIGTINLTEAQWRNWCQELEEVVGRPPSG